MEVKGEGEGVQQKGLSRVNGWKTAFFSVLRKITQFAQNALSNGFGSCLGGGRIAMGKTRFVSTAGQAPAGPGFITGAAHCGDFISGRATEIDPPPPGSML
jgi:hypothetical protein